LKNHVVVVGALGEVRCVVGAADADSIAKGEKRRASVARLGSGGEDGRSASRNGYIGAFFAVRWLCVSDGENCR